MLTTHSSRLSKRKVEVCYDSFRSVPIPLHQSQSLISNTPQPPAAALSPPQQLLEALTTLREIMLVYSSSLLDTTTPLTTSPSALRESEFSQVLVEGLDPALAMCEKMSEFRPVQWEKDIFRINCYEAVVGMLEGFNFAGERVRTLEGFEGEAVERLIAEHVSAFSIWSEVVLISSGTVYESGKGEWVGTDPHCARNER